MVDALGSITIQFESQRENLGSSFDEAMQVLRRRITDNSITHADIRASSEVPQGMISAIADGLKNTGVRAYNCWIAPVPLAPVRLDFRVAATRDSDDLPGLTEEQIEQLIALKKQPVEKPKPDSVASKYTWLEIEKEAAKDMTSAQTDMIVISPDKSYLLVSTEPAGTMLSTDKDDRAWKIVRAESVEDFAGNPAIALELDESGARRLGELTASHHRRPLAVIINNKVFMAPRILTKITNRVQITGNLEARVGRPNGQGVQRSGEGMSVLVWHPFRVQLMGIEKFGLGWITYLGLRQATVCLAYGQRQENNGHPQSESRTVAKTHHAFSFFLDEHRTAHPIACRRQAIP